MRYIYIPSWELTYPLPKHFWRYVSSLEGIRVLDLQQIYVEKVTSAFWLPQKNHQISKGFFFRLAHGEVRALPGVVSMVGILNISSSHQVMLVDGQKSCEKTHLGCIKPVASGSFTIPTGWPDFFHQQYHPSSSCKKEKQKKPSWGWNMLIRYLHENCSVCCRFLSLSFRRFFPCLLASCLQSKSEKAY